MNQPEQTLTDFDRKLGALLAQRVGHNRRVANDEQPIDDISVEIGRIIRKQRIAKRKTLRQVGEAAHIPTAHVAALENGIVLSTFIELKEIDAVAAALSLDPNLFREMLGQPKKSAETQPAITEKLARIANQMRNQWRWGQAYFGSRFNLVQHVSYSTLALILFVMLSILNRMSSLPLPSMASGITNPLWFSERVTALISLMTVSLLVIEFSQTVWRWSGRDATRRWRLQRRFLQWNSLGFVITFAIYSSLLSEHVLPQWLQIVRSEWLQLDQIQTIVDSPPDAKNVLSILVAAQLMGLGALYWLQAKIIRHEGRIRFAFSRRKPKRNNEDYVE